jgi:uncharacterized protein DUF1761
MLSSLTLSRYVAILIAALAGFAFGAVWYTLLGRQWMAARGPSVAEAKAKTGPSPVPFIVSFVALLYVLTPALVFGALGAIFRTGTYVYATTGQAPSPMHPALLQGAFRKT